MLRSAAKNHDSVTVVVDPFDYAEVADQIKSGGNTTLELRRKLAAKVFARTAAYDAAIAAHLQKGFGAENSATPAFDDFPPLAQPLRYGENPHQAAALYGKFNEYFQQLHGKELSYNNILDLTAAANLIAEFSNDPPTLAILKHTNPCGVGQGRKPARGVGQGVRHGQTGAVRRHHRREQAARRRVRRGHRGNFQRGHRRAGIHRRGAGHFAEEEKICGC